MRPIRFIPITLALATLPIAACVSGVPDFRSDPPFQTSAAQSARGPSSPQGESAPRGEAVHHARSGPWELALGGAGISNDRVSAGSGQVTGAVGYYLNDVVELLVRQNASYSNDGAGSSDVWTAASRVALDVHLPLGNVVPYVGANLGYAYGTLISDSLMGGPEAGIKFYVKDDVFVLLSGEYQFFFDSSDSLNSAFDDGQILYGLMLGVRF